MLLLRETYAIKLETQSPSAEQALAQIDIQQGSNHCLCYQYHTKNAGTIDVSDIGVVTVTVTTEPVLGHLADKGGLIPATNGKCEDQNYLMIASEANICIDTESGVDAVAQGASPACCALTANQKCAFGTPTNQGAACATNADVAAGAGTSGTTFSCPAGENTYVGLVSTYGVHPDGLYVKDGDETETHKVVPVSNESCLYSLWMCACWANQAEGCLCAYEAAEQAYVTIEKPTMGHCRSGSSALTDVTAAGDGIFPVIYGAGGLALKCSPNPCQACCKHGGNKGCKCGGGKGGGGQCDCGGGGGGGYGICQSVNTPGGGGGGGGGCCCCDQGGHGGGGGYCNDGRQDCIDTCG